MPERFPPTLLGPLKLILDKPKKIVIVTHFRPDGDAMGSSLGLYNYLKLKGHSARVIIPSSSPDFLEWMKGNEQVIDFEKDPKEGELLITDAELVFCLDFNLINRVEKMELLLRNFKGKKILIDHHLDPENAYDFPFSYSDACATCELIYQFIVALGDKNLITKDIAECLYCGIMTDTNSFRYETMRASTHGIIAELINAGAVNHKIHEKVYDNYSEHRLHLLGHSLRDKLVVLPEFRTAYISLSEAELRQYNFEPGDSEGIVNYALSVKDVKLAVFFIERDGIIKMSLRSKDDFSVKDLSKKHFEGGGHRNASGGHSKDSLEKTIRKFLDLLPLYKSELLK